MIEGLCESREKRGLYHTERKKTKRLNEKVKENQIRLTHEKIIGLRTKSSHFEQLHQIKELAMYISTYLTTQEKRPGESNQEPNQTVPQTTTITGWSSFGISSVRYAK